MAPEDQQVRKEEEAAERELRAAAEAAHKAEIRQAAVKAHLDNVLRATRDTLSRRRAASIAGLTPGRVQQIIDSDPSDGVSLGETRAVQSLGPAELGSVLRDLREDQGRSLEELAAAAGIHTTVLSRIERGTTIPSSRLLNACIEALGGRLVAEFGPGKARTSPDA